MGMFDDLRCNYPLPLVGANDLAYQTKDTPEQWMDQYEIREDGTLWHEAYDVEDHSDLAKWKAAHPGENPPAEMASAISAFIGCLTRVNKRWEQVPLTGEVTFHTLYEIVDGKLVNAHSRSGWLSWSAYFVAGQLKELHLLENRTPENTLP